MTTSGLSNVLITTNRLSLRTLYAGLVTDEQIAWLNDPEVVRYSEQRHKKHTLESQHAYVNGLWAGPGNYIWLISTSAKPIGTITAYCDLNNKVADIGIMIGDRAQWGFGYGTEAWQGVMKWLFETGARKVEAGCMSKNTAMIQVCMKSRMHVDGRRDDHFLCDGQPTDLIYYARFA